MKITERTYVFEDGFRVKVTRQHVIGKPRVWSIAYFQEGRALASSMDKLEGNHWAWADVEDEMDNLARHHGAWKLRRPQVAAADRGTYEQLKANSELSSSESRDCSVVAVAAACEVDYDTAHAALAKQGRQNGRGVYLPQIVAAIKALGCQVEELSPQDFIQERYPAGHKILKSVTTHHPERFPGVFREGENFILSTRGHVAAVVDGELVDWSRGRSLQCRKVLYKVTKA